MCQVLMGSMFLKALSDRLEPILARDVLQETANDSFKSTVP